MTGSAESRFDPLVTELFRHLRQSVDILEQIAQLAARSTRTTHQPETSKMEPHHRPALPMIHSIKDVCRLIGLSRSTVYKVIQSGELRSLKRGRRRLVRTEDLSAWVNSWQRRGGDRKRT